MALSQKRFPGLVSSKWRHFDQILKLIVIVKIGEQRDGDAYLDARTPGLSVRILGTPRFVSVVRDIAIQTFSARFGDGTKRSYPSSLNIAGNDIACVYWVKPGTKISLDCLTVDGMVPTGFEQPDEHDMVLLKKLGLSKFGYIRISVGISSEDFAHAPPETSEDTRRLFEEMSYPPEQGKWPWDPVDVDVESRKGARSP
ncbi:MAG: hypothetical protein HYV27_16220 [Candidatus Hydrogenedentes bacterium]|nr:hypothetical protein [Candidatus Hydrogenedentota bacterium]